MPIYQSCNHSGLSDHLQSFLKTHQQFEDIKTPKKRNIFLPESSLSLSRRTQ